MNGLPVINLKLDTKQGMYGVCIYRVSKKKTTLLKWLPNDTYNSVVKRCTHTLYAGGGIDHIPVQTRDHIFFKPPLNKFVH